MPRWLSHLALAAAVAATSACTRTPKAPPSPAEPPKPVATLTADQLIDEYKKNEVGADQKFKDKLVQVSGKVAEVKKDLFGRYFVGLGTAHEGEMFDVMCYLDKTAEEAAGKLQKGETATLMGMCQGRAGGLVLTLKSCIVVK